ncbi:LOW QUALITY PROTEIN: uncharacterized protein ACR2FA_009982 [Aphomia sociella]
MKHYSTVDDVTTKLRYLLVLSAFCSAFFFILTVVTGMNSLSLKPLTIEDDTKNFTIKTEGCTIPYMIPLGDDVKEYVYYPKSMKKCEKRNATFLEHNKTHIWINKDKAVDDIDVNNDMALISCCYKAFFMPKSIDNIELPFVDDRVKYGSCIYFSNVIQVRDEFVKVSCYAGDILLNEDYLLFALKKFVVHNDKREISNDKSAYNILIIGIDAVSKLNFYRTMPKTLSYLKSKGAINLEGFNKVGDNTFPNLIALLLGISSNELKKTCLPHRNAAFDNCPFIWEWFKQVGYYTAFGEDGSRLRAFNYDGAGFVNSPTDYYTHTFINEAEKNAGNNKDIFSYLCMNDKYFYKVMLDYVNDLTSILKDTKLFVFWEFSVSHDYLNYPMIMDDSYVDFLKKLESKHYLDNTILILLSDHGLRWGEFRLTEQGRLEERLPFAFILTPQSFREVYTGAYNNLKLNSQRLTTPFDIHGMLLDLIDLKNIKNEKIFSREQESYAENRSISLFLPVPSNRTCKLAGISQHWCTCYREKAISTDDPDAIMASLYLISYFNNILSDFSQCAQLRLAEIVKAAEIILDTVSDDNATNNRVIMVVLRVRPGDGIFEGTLNRIDGSWSISGTVSRLNMYGDQGKCMSELHLRLYCYCINDTAAPAASVQG